ncbi:MAG: tyrosine-type recombinase/integrase, partial [Magnetococcus sp. XQGC-1]
RKAGIENFHIHDLRHTCAAWLVTSGVALPEVRDLLGHSTIRMTERYAHLAPENIRAAVAVLDRGHVLVTVDNEEQKTASRSTS